MVGLYAGVAGFGGPPTKTQVDRQAGLTGDLDRANGEFTALTGDRLAALNARVQAAGLDPVKVLTAAEHAARE